MRHADGCRRGSRRTLALAAAVGVAAAVLVAGDTGRMPLPNTARASPDALAPALVAHAAGTGVRAPAAARPVARVVPVRLRVPSIGVDTRLEQLDLGARGELVPPSQPGRAGWFRKGAVPGDIGPAVLAGHVDSRTGPAVFYRLSRLAAGDLVVVDRSDGRSARFLVTSVRRHRKDAFPTELVYGATPGRELRLITCGGPYRGGAGYRDNVVVTATLAA